MRHLALLAFLSVCILVGCWADLALADAPAPVLLTAPPPLPTTLLPAPASLDADGSDGAVTLAWSTVQGAASYTLYWAPTPRVDTATADRKTGITGTTHTVLRLRNGTPYYFVVAAVNAVGESKPSHPEAKAVPFPFQNGATTMDQCKHAGSNPDEIPYACVWLMGDGYAQVLKSGDSSAAIGIGVQYASFLRRTKPDLMGLHRMANFQEGSVFIKKGSASTINGTDPASYAAMILDPQTAAFSYDLRFRLEPWRLCDSDALWGFASYASGGSARWAYPGLGPAGGEQVNVFAWGVGPTIRILPDWMEKNFVSVTLAAMATQRVIVGAPAMRHAIFNTKEGDNDHTFTGAEAQVKLDINTVSLRVVVPFLNGSADRISGGQIFMSLSLRTGALLN